MTRIYKYKDYTGKKIGLLTILKRIKYQNEKGQLIWAWECECDCGNNKIIPSYSLNSGTKSCGCIINKGKKLPLGEKPKRDLFYAYRQSAEIREIPFDLDIAIFEKLTSSSCFYCGELPRQKRINTKHKHDIYYYNGIDRIDNMKGYLVDNCVACCKTCNYAKREMSKEDFSKWISRVYSHLKIKDLS